MPRNCCVNDCRSSDDFRIPEIKFHPLPSQDIYRKEWVEILEKHSKKINVNKQKYIFVCSKHFKESDYVNNGPTKKLIKGRFPHIFEKTEINM